MGNYVFTHRRARRRPDPDAEDPDSKHDMGGNIVPMLVERGEAGVYDFRDNDVPGSDRPNGATGGTSAPWTASTTPTWT